MVGMAPGPGWYGVAADLLQRALPVAGMEWGQVTARLNTGHARLWIAQDGNEAVAAIVTQLTTDDVYEAILAGGTRAREWVPAAVAAICAWAWQIGAVKCRVWGRPGWQRLLPDWSRVGVEDGLVILERGPDHG